MTNTKKLDENQKWAMVMTILPVVILMNAGRELTNDSSLSILYSGAFGGIGGLIGFAANYFTKHKSRVIKTITTAFILLFSLMTISLLSLQPSDERILEQEWITQKIGNIEFNLGC